MHVQMKTVRNFRFVECNLCRKLLLNTTQLAKPYEYFEKKERMYAEYMQIRRSSQFIEFVFRDTGLSGNQKMMIVRLL